jgi:hypothetical protein
MTIRFPASPRGILASGLSGAVGAALGWAVTWLGNEWTISLARLDQVTALALGAGIGSTLLAARARRIGRPASAEAAIGAIIGGAATLLAVSLVAQLHSGNTPRSFLFTRVLAWALAGAALAAMLTTYLGLSTSVRRVESTLLGAAGGAGSALIMSLPGITDLWQVTASLWFGFAVAVAVCGPELWHAIAVVTLLPSRGRPWSLWQLREVPLYDGMRTSIGAAQLVCADGRVAVYPPAGGATADGRRVRRARYIVADSVIGAGRARGECRLSNPT